MQRIAIILILSVFVACSANAAIRVERDGSGDFVNIQDAVDAAASGDTLLIGPGRWDEMFTYTPPQGGWTDDVIIVTDGKDLTLIGAGQDETIIGPETPPAFGLSGPNAVVLATYNRLEILNMTIENMSAGLYAVGTDIILSSVRIQMCGVGYIAFGPGPILLQDCLFNVFVDGGIAATPGVAIMMINSCIFEGGTDYYITARHVENIIISDCFFRDGVVAVQFDGTTCRGTIERCVVETGRGPHFAAVSGSRMELFDCTLVGGLKQLAAVGYAEITGSGNQFMGTTYGAGSYATIHVQLATLNLHGNHILKGDAPLTLLCTDYILDDPFTLDLRNNYWGTASADTLAAWIWNEDDDPDQNLVTLIEPFSPQPVPEEKTGTGDMKRMFR